eukprot:8874676-Pyramimonas_sp.AAC.1
MQGSMMNGALAPVNLSCDTPPSRGSCTKTVDCGCPVSRLSDRAAHSGQLQMSRCERADVEM